jgi:hypothetical protein
MEDQPSEDSLYAEMERNRKQRQIVLRDGAINPSSRRLNLPRLVGLILGIALVVAFVIYFSAYRS